MASTVHLCNHVTVVKTKLTPNKVEIKNFDTHLV